MRIEEFNFIRDLMLNEFDIDFDGFTFVDSLS